MTQNTANWDEQAIQLEKVEDGKDNYYLTYDGGWTFGVKKSYFNNGFKPEAGMTGILWTSNFSHVRGLRLDNHAIFYTSREDAEREHAEWCVAYDAKKKQAYVENIDSWRAELAEMHPAFKARIERFINESSEENFYVENGGYDHFIAQQGSLLLSLYSTEAEIDAFNDLSHGEQLALGWNDGHSGFTHSCAVGMAKAVIRGEKI